MYVCMYLCVFVCVYVCIYVCVCMYVCVCIYVCMYICTYLLLFSLSTVNHIAYNDCMTANKKLKKYGKYRFCPILSHYEGNNTNLKLATTLSRLHLQFGIHASCYHKQIITLILPFVEDRLSLFPTSAISFLSHTKFPETQWPAFGTQSDSVFLSAAIHSPSFVKYLTFVTYLSRLICIE